MPKPESFVAPVQSLFAIYYREMHGKGVSINLYIKMLYQSVEHMSEHIAGLA